MSGPATTQSSPWLVSPPPPGIHAPWTGGLGEWGWGTAQSWRAPLLTCKPAFSDAPALVLWGSRSFPCSFMFNQAGPRGDSVRAGNRLTEVKGCAQPLSRLTACSGPTRMGTLQFSLCSELSHTLSHRTLTVMLQCGL